MKKRKPASKLEKQRRKHLRLQRELAKAFQLPLPYPFFEIFKSEEKR